MISFILNIDEENQKRIPKFLESFESFINVNNDKLELVLIVKPEQKNIINKFSKFNLNKSISLKVVYSIKTLSINKQLKFASKIATNDYIWWIDPNVKYNKELLFNVIKIIKNDNVDLIEILPEFEGMIKWNPKVRHNLKPLTILNISENENIIAYMFPFIANKVFNRKISLSILNENKFNDVVDYSTPLSIEFLYQYILKSKTYVWISKQKIAINIKENIISHYNHILNEWTRLKDYYENSNSKKYISELKYAEVYYLLIILTSFYATKNISNIFNDSQMYKKKYYEKLTKLFQNEMKSFENENKYMINKNNENLFLKQIPQISKWNKLLLKL